MALSLPTVVVYVRLAVKMLKEEAIKKAPERAPFNQYKEF
jgi:hypothetical protein